MTLEELFKEAAQSNDAKTVYLRLVDIYERCGKFEVRPTFAVLLERTVAHVSYNVQAEEELFQRLVKKFGQSSKAWTLFGQFYLTRGRAAEARELLPRSLKSLEKRKRAVPFTRFLHPRV